MKDDVLTDSERHIIRSFGHREGESFSDEELARRVLAFPDASEGWYHASAVTLAGGYLLALDRLEAAEIARNEAIAALSRELEEKEKDGMLALMAEQQRTAHFIEERDAALEALQSLLEYWANDADVTTDIIRAREVLRLSTAEDGEEKAT